MIRTDRFSFDIGDFRLHQVGLEVTKGEYFKEGGPGVGLDNTRIEAGLKQSLEYNIRRMNSGAMV